MPERSFLLRLGRGETNPPGIAPEPGKLACEL
jgi:hypothetical protein